MTIPVDLEGVALPVSPALLDILHQEVTCASLGQAPETALTFHFRNPTYNPEKGGIHPVEIRLIRKRGDWRWRFDYITDFSYQGLGQDAELCKELDFNIQDGEHYMQGWGPLPVTEAHELFTLWQSNFITYAQLGFFSVTVSGE